MESLRQMPGHEDYATLPLGKMMKMQKKSEEEKLQETVFSRISDILDAVGRTVSSGYQNSETQWDFFEFGRANSESRDLAETITSDDLDHLFTLDDLQKDRVPVISCEFTVESPRDLEEIIRKRIENPANTLAKFDHELFDQYIGQMENAVFHWKNENSDKSEVMDIARAFPGLGSVTTYDWSLPQKREFSRKILDVSDSINALSNKLRDNFEEHLRINYEPVYAGVYAEFPDGLGQDGIMRISLNDAWTENIMRLSKDMLESVKPFYEEALALLHCQTESRELLEVTDPRDIMIGAPLYVKDHDGFYAKFDAERFVASALEESHDSQIVDHEDARMLIKYTANVEASPESAQEYQTALDTFVGLIVYLGDEDKTLYVDVKAIDEKKLLEAVQRDPEVLGRIPENMRSEEVCRKALILEPGSVQYLPAHLNPDPEFRYPKTAEINREITRKYVEEVASQNLNKTQGVLVLCLENRSKEMYVDFTPKMSSALDFEEKERANGNDITVLHASNSIEQGGAENPVQ